MKILYAASEAAPFAATGGLGDVMASLPAAVLKKCPSAQISVVLPLYASVRERFGDELCTVLQGEVSLAWRRLYFGVLSLSRGGITYLFIDNEYYFKRDSFYGDFDDGERFAFFSAAILRYIELSGDIPDVIHANDWQTALVPVYLRLWYGKDRRFREIRCVYTIHNIGYRGQFSPDSLWDVFGIWNEDRWVLDYDSAADLTKGAVVCADLITTVSPTYAREILTPFHSAGLHHILRENSGRLVGILNGIDTERYDPATDPFISENYSAEKLCGKSACRRELCRIAGFPESDVRTPIVGMVSRLAAHKGFDLVTRVILEMIDGNDARFVLLGTGDSRFEGYFRWLSEVRPGCFFACLTFDSALASKIYAGADIFLMPSLSEPCGLSQMIAARYGAVPVVREVGGLADSIRSVDDSGEGGCGFSFSDYNAHDMMYTLRRAARMYSSGEIWERVVHSAMTADFSWDSSAEKYIELYTHPRRSLGEV